MIYKRTTKQLQDAGIEHIVIVKRPWGPAPEDIRTRKQTSQCFKSWQKAVQAVLEGYRPEVHEFLPNQEPPPARGAALLVGQDKGRWGRRGSEAR